MGSKIEIFGVSFLQRKQNVQGEVKTVPWVSRTELSCFIPLRLTPGRSGTGVGSRGKKDGREVRSSDNNGVGTLRIVCSVTGGPSSALPSSWGTVVRLPTIKYR